MTTPDTITVSLDWAKKLKEAGWPQTDSVWDWVGTMLIEVGGEPTAWSLWDKQKPEYTKEWEPDIYAAPTAEEIMRALPTYLRVLGSGKEGGKGGQFHVDAAKWGSKTGDVFLLRYKRAIAPKILNGSHFRESSLANCAAALWCHLAESKLLPTP